MNTVHFKKVSILKSSTGILPVSRVRKEQARSLLYHLWALGLRRRSSAATERRSEIARYQNQEKSNRPLPLSKDPHAISGEFETVDAIVDRVPLIDVNLISTTNIEAVHLLLLTHRR